MGGQGVQKFLRHPVWIGVQKTDPKEFVNTCQRRQQLRQAVAQSQIFAVGSSVLADQRDFASSSGGQIFRFAQHRFEPPAAEFSAQLWNDAERAGMIAAFGDFYVSGGFWSGENARGQIVIKKSRRPGGQDTKIAGA